MRVHRIGTIVALLVLTLTTWGCAHVASYSEEEMYSLAAALTKLSAAVESAVAFRDPPEKLSQRELLEFATQHDPSLLQPLDRFTLHVLRQGGHAGVLVCTPEGARALLEDAGCTARLERHWWKEDLQKPCAFTLDLSVACPVR
ncbi:MAG: hypothetical protein M5R38_04020 [Candidatus Methylomirabilis sp.]|nr:hypothetical protein [Candidatus Methylomirabilis sp.]